MLWIQAGWAFFQIYAVLVLAISCLPLTMIVLWLFRRELDMRLGKIFLFSVSFVVFGLASMVVFGMLHDWEVFPNSTFQHQGLIFFAPLWLLAAAKILKRDWHDLFDVFAVVIPFVVAGVRLYCISQGCCYGRQFFRTEYDWPVREITIVLNLITGIVLLRFAKREHTSGILIPVYLMIYSIIRFLEVTFWGDIYRDQHYLDRGLALLSFGIGLVLYLKFRSMYCVNHINKLEKGKGV